MCGIVGLWNLDGAAISPEMLTRFTDTLQHRGPDGSQLYVDHGANLGFGHRRLAILDTSDSGRQPMSYAQDRYWITYNGEIYNFIELRKELEQLGYQFHTESDTEIIMAAYDRWGQDCQLRFNGMWAFAIWDRRIKQLFISRDRFGVKPLHYYYDGEKFAFASEMKAFLALDWYQPDFVREIVAAALVDNELIEGTEQCLLQGIKRLLAGHCLTLQVDGNLKIHRWWNTLDHLDTIPRTYEDQVLQFRDLFLDACRIRMRSDVPIGTSLSGGLDSSSIVCGMNQIREAGLGGERLASDWQRAFIATYPGADIDEREYADEVLKATDVIPTYCVITPDMYLQNYDQILFQFEEISDIYLGPWLVHKTQRETGVVVTIDGHGGDELLGGYPWHVTSAMIDSIVRISPRRAIELLNTLRGMELFPKNEFLLRSLIALGTRWRDRLLERNGNPWLLCAPVGFKSSAYEADSPRLRERDHLFKRLYTDFHFTQLPTNLRDFDRLSMAHGVEVRSPFMDWRLVCFLFSLPASAKIRRGYTKQILRDALIDILPEPIRLRTRKLGFPNMMESWSSPRSLEFIRDSVASKDFQDSTIWDGHLIKKDLELAYRSGNQPRVFKAWTYVQAMSLIKMFRERWSQAK